MRGVLKTGHSMTDEDEGGWDVDVENIEPLCWETIRNTPANQGANPFLQRWMSIGKGSQSTVGNWPGNTFTPMGSPPSQLSDLEMDVIQLLDSPPVTPPVRPLGCADELEKAKRADFVETLWPLGVKKPVAPEDVRQFRASGFTFTVQGWKPTFERYLQMQLSGLASADSGVAFVVAGIEKAPTTGTFHLQGFISFCPWASNTSQFRRRGTTVWKLIQSNLGNALHLEVAREDLFVNTRYCTKDGCFAIAGSQHGLTWDKYLAWKNDSTASKENTKFGQQGKRKDCEDWGALLVSKKGVITKDDTELYGAVVKYPAGMKMLSSLLSEKRRKPPHVICIYGKTGVGKDWIVEELYGAEGKAMDIYYVPCMGGKQGLWWDGLNPNQEVVVFSDFRSNAYSFGDLLKLLDRYPYRVPYKGGSHELNAHTIIFTCPKHPWDWYPGIAEVHRNQLLRRFVKPSEENIAKMALITNDDEFADFVHDPENLEIFYRPRGHARRDFGDRAGGKPPADTMTEEEEVPAAVAGFRVG